MALEWLLDTNICIYIAKERPPIVATHFARHAMGTVGIIPVIELGVAAGEAYQILARADRARRHTDRYNTGEFERVPGLTLENWAK